MYYLFFYLKSFYYIKYLILIICIDGLIFDDEPVWEPLEWSLVQTWLLYIFLFTWFSEVTFSSKYGLYTNRDKKVWIGLFKVYWFFQYWFIANLFIITLFVTLPFYFEITYLISYIVLWWTWFNSIFFFKITLISCMSLFILTILKFQLRFLNLNTLYLYLFILLLLVSYLLYFNYIFINFLYFTDDSQYLKSGWLNSNQLVHGPLKWSYGSSSRDHFSFHKSTTVFWFKNDPLISSSMLFINLFYFFFIFFLFLQTLLTIKLIISYNNVSYNNITVLYTSFKLFFYFLFYFFTLIIISYIYQFLRFPFEFYWYNKLFLIIKTIVLVYYDLLLLVI